MTTQSGTGIERHKAERLGARGFDHLENIDTRLRVDELEFIDQRNIHRAEDILQNFHGLRCCSRRHRNDLLDEGGIKFASNSECSRSIAANTLGMAAVAKAAFPG